MVTANLTRHQNRLENAGNSQLSAILALFEKHRGLAGNLYVHDDSLPALCPAALENFTVPRYFAGDWLQRVPQPARGRCKVCSYWPSLFLGPEGSSSALHVDALGTHFFM